MTRPNRPSVGGALQWSVGYGDMEGKRARAGQSTKVMRRQMWLARRSISTRSESTMNLSNRRHAVTKTGESGEIRSKRIP